MPSPDAEAAVTQVVDWRPSSKETRTWTLVAIAAMVVGLPLFALPSVIRAGPAGATFPIGLVDVLLTLVLTVVLVIVHEAIHALVMRRFGARPRFGAVLVGGAMPALYVTAPGHHFTRGQYLAVAAAPAVTISVLGFLSGFGPWGGLLILPLALHLGGCVGDGFAAWRVLREPKGTEFEDLRDGIRFHGIGT